MRTAFLIISGNCLAFALGSVVTIWLMGGPAVVPGPAAVLPAARTPAAKVNAPPAAPPAEPAASVKPSPAVEPTTTSLPVPETQPAKPVLQELTASAPPAPTALPEAEPPAAKAAEPPADEALAATELPIAPPPFVAAPPPTEAAEPVVPPPPAAAAPHRPKPQAAVKTGGAYVLQLGAFQDVANATHLRSTLRNRGYAPYIVPSSESPDGLTMVRIGGFADHDAASAAAAALQADVGIQALVMKTGAP